MTKGSEVLRVSATKDPETQEKLAELDKSYLEFQAAVSSILGNLQALVNAKQAGRRVVDDSESLLAAAQKLTDAYEQELAGRTTNFIVLAVVVLLALGAIALLVKVYLDDTRRSRRGSRAPARRDRRHQQGQPGRDPAADERDGQTSPTAT